MNIEVKELNINSCDFTRAELFNINLSGIDFSNSNIEGIRVNSKDVKGMIININQGFMLLSLLGVEIKEVLW